MLGWALLYFGGTAAALALTVAFAASSFAFVTICVLIVVRVALWATGSGRPNLPSHAVNVFRSVHLSRNEPKVIDIAASPNTALMIDDEVGGNWSINKLPDVTVNANIFPIKADLPVTAGIPASPEDVTWPSQIGLRAWLLIVGDYWWRTVRAFESLVRLIWHDSGSMIGFII